VTRAGLNRAIAYTYSGVVEGHTLQMAAALSYYLVLSVFPALILFFAAVASLPFPAFYSRIFDLLSRLLPAQTVPEVQSVLQDVLSTDHRVWLSLGTIGTVWVASSAFDAMIEALNVAYEVREVRPFWKTRLLAVGLAAATGCLVFFGLTVMILGPRFGEWLSGRIPLPAYFVSFWPLFHWLAAVAVALAGVELMYFAAPNVKQRFVATLPGAILAVLCWIGLSYLLGFYFRHIANFSRTYGTLGGFIAFMTWFYWNSLALLVGAYLNAGLANESAQGSIPQKEPDVAADTLDAAS
jgi:membrane protein